MRFILVFCRSEGKAGTVPGKGVTIIYVEISPKLLPSLGAFAKLRKATTFVMSVCLSVRAVRMEELCSHWMDFLEIGHLSIFRKSIEKIEV
jgi:hypothetical protein